MAQQHDDKPEEVERVENVLDQLRGDTDYLKWNEVDQPEETAPEVRIRPISENKEMNHVELDGLRKAGFVLSHVDMDNEEVWVRE